MESTPSPPAASAYDWRSIVALNLVSTLAQVAQFGIAFVVLPVWLAQQGAGTLQLSLYGASLWLGQVPGLGLAPWLTRRLGARAVVVLALLCSAAAFAALALRLHPGAWLPAGLLAGFGQGLRWIGLEPWLYGIAPSHAQGRLIGFHETLIALAPILAPVLAAWAGIAGPAPLYLGLGFLLAAALPLLLARAQPQGALAAQGGVPMGTLLRDPVFRLGAAVALVGGSSEAAFLGMFPVFGQAHGLDATQIASLLTAFGLGGVVFQYLAGWLADHRGMVVSCLACCLCTAALALLLAGDWSLPVLHAALFCLGGLVTAYLTLALIASAKAGSGTLSTNMSLMSLIYTLSAVSGPLLGGAAVQLLGSDGLVWTLAVLAGALAAWTATRLRVHR